MQIQHILINHMPTPLGFELKSLTVSFQLQDTTATAIQKRLTIAQNGETCYQSQWSAFPDNQFDLDLALLPRTRYDVLVEVQADAETASATSWFETGKMSEPWQAEWIAAPTEHANTVFSKAFTVAEADANARLYLTGLGVYEAYLDGEKIGDEFLAPGVTAYDRWVQVQTYPLNLSAGAHTLTVSVGDGWYKGNYGFDGGQDHIYGDTQMIIGELHTKTQVIPTDGTWSTAAGQITKSAIYYGEDDDATRELTAPASAQVLQDADKARLSDRLSLPLKAQETLSVKQVIHTPAGETVLDFGQNQAGWFTFYDRLPKGGKLKLEAGEILQGGNFYRDNLRAARAAFTYISDGESKWVRPHFTYFGYRYVRVSGDLADLRPEDFKAVVIYSTMPTTGALKTDDLLVNRLFQNILWGQKSNFFDVPTDCPQRDERLGWTGDADIFSATAALNMDVFAFFKKYARDMALEQADHEGMLTMYAPAMGVDDGGAAVWGDAATIIPWNMYQAYGDPAILRQNYAAMQSWVDWITKHTQKANLWTGGFQFGDWIALDGENPALPTGKTDEDFIASVYYYYSSWIVSQTAQLFGDEANQKRYGQLADAIRAAIRQEYITANGRLAIDTQTAYALALAFDLIPQTQKPRVVADLVRRLGKDDDHLKTGFVGTPFICRVLSENGEHKLAMKLFMNDDFPSWLYAVKMGATTVWERWNSVQADGSMNPDGMNSLNHYSIGAIMEWAYQQVLGIAEHTPGYQQVTIAPQFDYRLKQVSGHFDSPYGRLAIAYQIETDAAHTVKVNLQVPVGMHVTVRLPRATGQAIQVNGQALTGELSLSSGTYALSYIPTEDYIERYSLQTPVATIMSDADLVAKLDQVTATLGFFKDPQNVANLGKMTLPKLNELLPFINIPAAEMQAIAQILTTTPLPQKQVKA